MKIGQVHRYAARKNPAVETVDGLPNFFNATRAPDGTVVLLERGINPIRAVRAASGHRVPAIVIRSSPHKAGSAATPWQDFFDTDNGRVRYYGDNRVDRVGGADQAPGNRLLNNLMTAHTSSLEAERALSVPLVLFRSISAGGRSKGQVEFQGFGLIERSERVTQWDGNRSAHFGNYVFDIAVLSCAEEDESFSWDWINARRTPSLSDEQCLRLAPASWQAWARQGNSALPRLRRSVAKPESTA
jgi:Restriction endonuclease AspBHI N-terminal